MSCLQLFLMGIIGVNKSGIVNGSMDCIFSDFLQWEDFYELKMRRLFQKCKKLYYTNGVFNYIVGLILNRSV